MRIHTDYPAIVFYTHNLENTQLNASNQGLYPGFALEAQYPALGIHEEKLQLPLLKKDDTYKHNITFKVTKKP